MVFLISYETLAVRTLKSEIVPNAGYAMQNGPNDRSLPSEIEIREFSAVTVSPNSC